MFFIVRDHPVKENIDKVEDREEGNISGSWAKIEKVWSPSPSQVLNQWFIDKCEMSHDSPFIWDRDIQELKSIYIAGEHLPPLTIRGNNSDKK